MSLHARFCEQNVWVTVPLEEAQSRVLGLVKCGLPPGHAYKMRRHRGIPNEVRWQSLPPDLKRRLSRLPDGYAHIVIGADVGILHGRTRVVLDVIEDLHD